VLYLPIVSSGESLEKEWKREKWMEVGDGGELVEELREEEFEGLRNWEGSERRFLTRFFSWDDRCSSFSVTCHHVVHDKAIDRSMKNVSRLRPGRRSVPPSPMVGNASRSMASPGARVWGRKLEQGLCRSNIICPDNNSSEAAVHRRFGFSAPSFVNGSIDSGLLYDV